MNWMHDQVEKTFNKELSQKELINQLTIQQIEYGRTCIAQFLSNVGGKTMEESEDYHYKFDVELTKIIKELGGKPIDIIIIK